MVLSKGGKKMKEPMLVLVKKADRTLNKIIVPKVFINKWGYDFKMKVYEDKIILEPIKKGE